MPYITGRITDFSPEVSELRLYTNGKLDESEGHDLNNMIADIKNKLDEPSVQAITTFFNMGIPMVPFPKVEDCLGLIPKDSHMELKDGYAVMAFDYDVRKSEHECLFNMKETLAYREFWLQHNDMMDKRNKLSKSSKPPTDIAGFAKYIEKAVGDADKLGISADLVKKAKESGFDGIRNVLKDVNIEQTA